MSRYCSDCRNLDDKDVKCDGIYKCEKIKDYVNANSPACSEFENHYGRTKEEKQKIYDYGKDAKKTVDTTPISVYLVVLLIIVIVWIIASLLGF